MKFLWKWDKLNVIRSGWKLLSLCAVLAFCVWGIVVVERRESRPVHFGREMEVLIVPGQSAGEIASEFQQIGIVARSRDLAVWMGRLGIDRKIRPGFYRIRAGYARDVAKALQEAKPDVMRVRILPGALFEELVGELGKTSGDVLLGEALEKEDNFPPGLRPLLPAKPEGRIVFLAPETYMIDPGDRCADHLVMIATRTWWRRHGDAIPEGVTAKELQEDGILASIVEKEAKLDSERPMIAGIFKNRLKKEMPLQSCATVVHAWRLRNVKVRSLRYDDLKIDSPFNTYVKEGLPPENIGVPSEGSWSAVLKPARTEMLFFVAKGDGSHVFTRTYREHIAVQRKIARGEL